jgi:hypothetical protein
MLVGSWLERAASLSCWPGFGSPGSRFLPDDADPAAWSERAAQPAPAFPGETTKRKAPMAGEPIPMHSTKVELLPCPFCGGEASADGRVSYTDNHEAWFADGTQVLEAFYCNCMKCGATRQPIVGGYQSRDLAITAWNTRSTPIVDVTRVEKLREAFYAESTVAHDLLPITQVVAIDSFMRAVGRLAALDGTRVDAGEGATQLDESGEAMVCTGCGTTRTIAGITQRTKTAFSCCPERKMVPVRDMWRVWCDAHAVTATSGTCPFCTGAAEYTGTPEEAFCARHLRLYRKANAA